MDKISPILITEYYSINLQTLCVVTKGTLNKVPGYSSDATIYTIVLYSLAGETLLQYLDSFKRNEDYTKITDYWNYYKQICEKNK